MTSNQETRIVSLTVDRVEDDNSSERDGVMRWKTYVFIPELGIKKYPTVLWVSADRPVKGTTLKARLSKGDLITRKDGSQLDAQYDSSFYWDVDGWDVDGEPAAPSNVTEFPRPGSSPRTLGDLQTSSVPANIMEPPLNDIDRRRAEDAFAYRRRDALNAAVAFLKDRVVPAMQSEEDVLDKATEYFTWLIEFDHPANIFHIPAEAPETAAAPTQQAEGAETQGNAVTLPNQVTAPENMTGRQFIDFYQKVSWDIKKVCEMLGTKHNVPVWLEGENRKDDYNYAWDKLVAVWTEWQTNTLVFP